MRRGGRARHAPPQRRYFARVAVIAMLFSPAVGATEVVDSDTVAQAHRYEHAEGVDLDYARAMALYCQAADRGDAEAAYNIGWMYFVGRGVARDDQMAARWLVTAAARGHQQARNIVARFRMVALGDPARCAAPEPPLAVPVGPAEIVKQVAALAPRYGLDPRLVLAVVQVESAFQVTAVSPKGASGLMQLLPETAERFGVADIFDVRQNLVGGMRYLRWLLAFFRGDVTLALAAYNAGEERVVAYDGVPPFAETQEYIRRIRTYYRDQRHPYAADLAKLHPVARADEQ